VKTQDLKSLPAGSCAVIHIIETVPSPWLPFISPEIYL